MLKQRKVKPNFHICLRACTYMYNKFTYLYNWSPTIFIFAFDVIDSNYVQPYFLVAAFDVTG